MKNCLTTAESSPGKGRFPTCVLHWVVPLLRGLWKEGQVWTVVASSLFWPLKSALSYKFKSFMVIYCDYSRASFELTGRWTYGRIRNFLRPQWHMSPACVHTENTAGISDQALGLTTLHAEVRSWGHPSTLLCLRFHCHRAVILHPVLLPHKAGERLGCISICSSDKFLFLSLLVAFTPPDWFQTWGISTLHTWCFQF
jgi:hypothetical protein